MTRHRSRVDDHGRTKRGEWGGTRGQEVFGVLSEADYSRVGHLP